jgi:hypothetical protein
MYEKHNIAAMIPKDLRRFVASLILRITHYNSLASPAALVTLPSSLNHSSFFDQDLHISLCVFWGTAVASTD